MSATHGPLRRESVSAELLRDLANEDYEFLSRLVHEETGMNLGPGKRALVASRLAPRIRQLGLSGYGAYCRLVRDAGTDERSFLFDALSTNETRFFRERAHFDFLSSELAPQWRTDAVLGRRPPRIRIWSAGCSTGEEPYSIAMAMLAAGIVDARLELEILGTDLSVRAIERACDGIYPIERSREIPKAHLEAFMLRGHGPRLGTMRVGPEVRRLVRFEHGNLQALESYGRFGRFDAIFCRNVLIYFDEATRRRVSRALLAQVAPSGHLFFGHADGMHSLDGARRVAPAVHAPLDARGPA